MQCFNKSYKIYRMYRILNCLPAIKVLEMFLVAIIQCLTIIMYWLHHLKKFVMMMKKKNFAKALFTSSQKNIIYSFDSRTSLSSFRSPKLNDKYNFSSPLSTSLNYWSVQLQNLNEFLCPTSIIIVSPIVRTS